MINASQYAQWYYLIYLVPGGSALLLLLLSALGGGMRHGHHSVGHHSVGHHHAIGHPAAGHHHSGAAHPAHGPGSPVRGQPMQAFFGLGRLPSPLLWGSALLGWGLFGFWGTQFWQSHLHSPALFALPSLVTAVTGALLAEKATVVAGGRLLPTDETFAVSTVDLCGQTGTVAYPVDDKRGRVSVYDVHGTLHDVSARALPGQPPIARGRKVLVTDYDQAHDQVIVEET